MSESTGNGGRPDHAVPDVLLVNDDEARGMMLDIVAGGDPHVLIVVRNLAGENFDVDLVIGGGLAEMDTVRALLRKVLDAADDGRFTEGSAPHAGGDICGNG
jgi:hypothetical protein